MCFEPAEVIKLIASCMRAHQLNDQKHFQELIDQLSQELGRVCEGVDLDALVHSFF